MIGGEGQRSDRQADGRDEEKEAGSEGRNAKGQGEQGDAR